MSSAETLQRFLRDGRDRAWNAWAASADWRVLAVALDKVVTGAIDNEAGWTCNQDEPPYQQIRSEHPDAYKSGEWGEILGFVQYAGRDCYVIAWPSGAGAEFDLWPTVDPQAAYEFRGGTSTGSARPPEVDLLAAVARERDLWRDTASGRGGIVESLRARAVRAEARVVPLEAALRAIEREAAESLAAYEACPRGYGYDWEAGQADGLRKAADIARAALVGDSPPAPRAPITGSGIDF